MTNCSLSLLFIAALLSASQPSVSDSRISSALNALQSSAWSDRSNAFYGIVQIGMEADSDSEFPVRDGVLAIGHTNGASRARLAEALTKLLATETDLVSSGAAPATEAYSNYYGDVIGAVATLRDPGSLHTLMRCINTGLMAQNALASFGEPALTEALKTLPAADEETRNSLFHLFSRMAEPQNRNSLRSDESRTTLLNVLLAGAKDSNPYNRETAVEGLARFSSPEAVKAIDRLATSDSYKVLDPDGKTRYPVREAAATARQVRRQMLLKKP